MKLFCNPLNVDYHYQFTEDVMGGGGISVGREAADPSLICFKGRYYMFVSMNLSVWVSDDLASWQSYPLPDYLPLYDYAPDVRVVGDYVYFCASRRGRICDYYRTKDVIDGPYERIEGTFDFWDPNLFLDDDGRLYFYWGCAALQPIHGVELDPETMKPITEPKALIHGDPYGIGFERIGEDHSKPPLTDAEIDAALDAFLKSRGGDRSMLPPDALDGLRGMLAQHPFIEGAWMTKHSGKYYLQYAFPGTEYNVYGDGVYISDSPLGDFVLAENNPYSYKPGGFIPGAGHGSTLEDMSGSFWHTATMRISVNQNFERRVGLWRAGFDCDGNLFCNQRYGDWVCDIDKLRADPWANPDWMLLSFGKKAAASSYEEGKDASKATDENVQTWWRAATNKPGEWLTLDLGHECDVRAVQINFADDKIDIPVPGEIQAGDTQPRFIDPARHLTRWTLEGSVDGEHWTMLCDKSKVDTNLPHDVVFIEDGMKLRHLRLTVLATPYDQAPCVSGLRVFGIGEGEKPAVPSYSAVRSSDLDMTVNISENGAVGYNILWGIAPDKLYHSRMTFRAGENVIGAMVKGREDVYVRVDAFSEIGITEGKTIKLCPNRKVRRSENY